MKKLINTKKAIFLALLALVIAVPAVTFAEDYGSGSLNSGSYGSYGNYGSGSLNSGSYGNYGSGSLNENYGSGSLNENYGSGSLNDYNTYSTNPVYDQSNPSYSSYSSPYSYSPECSSCGGYSYTPSSSYSYTPSPSYSYTPSQSYTYVPSSQSVNSSNSNYSSNTNTVSASNSNSITNNPVNEFNPTNNNDSRINLVVLGGGSSNSSQLALDGACTISPVTASVGQDLQFFANATGGNGNYTYNWSGDNGLSATAAAFTGKFMYPGTKTATVVITSNNQSITRTCSVNIQDSSISYIEEGTPISGVFLSEVPETGINLSLKMTLFSVGILMWSLFAAYIINAKRSKTLALANNTDVASRIEAFKQRNLAKKI